MTKIYDLHCHSTASDGVLSPTEVVQRAAEQGVNVLALCDHDTVCGIDEARLAAKEVGIELITGVEISTTWEGRGIHIVGLNFDQTHPKMTALLANQKALREKRAVEIGAKLEKAGIPNAYEGAKALANGEVTRAHYGRYLVQIGKVSNDGQAFRRYLGQGKSAFVKAEWVDIPTAIETIQAAGGMAVIAHPLRYNLTGKRIRQLMADFKSWGGDAMEISGYGQTKDQRQMLARWANEFGLLGSVGSDFHFPCGWVELGRNLDLPEGVEPIWTRF
ncbi:PHP domain-containing protein [Rodentibacter pneumotropicus]|uniref:Protein TrpH n=1 Tax=Rodentibacter pneumotropicus TaxID=758 RepID=A0A448MNR5_9PAST|nr:PHP domain-containing protein [Rodentibacter pneumotropicus]MDC2824836.1 PHP domain-containing protein [Rodentibacter pneumotropicus]NBH74852.1 PHP domain-containing protein [Rodentibacter pneumotropicus]OOF60786.1 phosphatase [Rodentibacter pneumotropicus]THA01930.1 PHP domain-containing protein [Rodentibacter pneumotropicus]THA05771.1 PHP domain-containing protein [Rodentibacter pneumotropicus]